MSTPISTPRKRVRGSPTGNTPLQLQKRSSSTRRTSILKRKLTYPGQGSRSRSMYTPAATWTPEEDKALVKYVLLFGSFDKWPATKLTKYWEGASRFVIDNCGSRRTSTFILSLSLSLSPPCVYMCGFECIHQCVSVFQEGRCV